MSELKYNHTFEQALEAVNEGHKVKHEEALEPCDSLEEMLIDVHDDIQPIIALDSWAIIKKKTDKELLIEHFCIDINNSPIAWVDIDNNLNIAICADTIGLHSTRGERNWSSFKKLANKEEVLSLYLERDLS